MINSLNDTIELMTSSDYKDRFKAEYYQLEYRYNRLLDMIKKWDNNELSFTPTCDRNIYTLQIGAMGQYLRLLQKRAEIEKVEL